MPLLASFCGQKNETVGLLKDHSVIASILSQFQIRRRTVQYMVHPLFGKVS